MNTEAAARDALLATARTLVAARLNVGTSGNTSVRTPDGMLITPSGCDPARARAADMVAQSLTGENTGPLAPSSEWRFHAALYVHRPEAGAVIHTHAPFATALACQRLTIPPFHYMIARFGGDTVRCAAYATFGTAALSEHVLSAIEGRSACLMANHGMLVFGRDLEQALALALEFETLCEQYWRTLQLGPPVLLTPAEMADAIERFKSYGKPATPRNS